jgi:hypothetical protein
MALRYKSGEAIQPGDRVLWGGEPSEIEFVAETPIGDREIDWHLRTDGPGVMVVELEPKLFGRVYLRDTEEDEDLVFVGRKIGLRGSRTDD